MEPWSIFANIYAMIPLLFCVLLIYAAQTRVETRWVRYLLYLLSAGVMIAIFGYLGY